MILVLAAMQQEFDALAKHLENSVSDYEHDIKYEKGYIGDKEVILALTGVGKVNATYTITTIFNHFPIDYVINIGSAGGVLTNREELDTLDVVVSTCVSQHDLDVTLAGREKGELENLSKYTPATYEDSWFDDLAEFNHKIHFGTIASGDQFIGDLKKVEEITNNFEDVLAVEMEAGAIAQICYRWRIPFIVMRSISDVVGKEVANHLQFEEYLSQASANSAFITSQIIKKLRL